MRSEDLDAALRRQHLWKPPSGFARRVLTRARASVGSRPARVSVLDLVFGAEQAVVSAASAYAGAWALWQLTPLLADSTMTAVDVCTMFATLATRVVTSNAPAVAWMSAACSLVIAAWFTRRSGLWT